MIDKKNESRVYYKNVYEIIKQLECYKIFIYSELHFNNISKYK